jgi:hypothetical protein
MICGWCSTSHHKGCDHCLGCVGEFDKFICECECNVGYEKQEAGENINVPKTETVAKKPTRRKSV